MRVFSLWSLLVSWPCSAAVAGAAPRRRRRGSPGSRRRRWPQPAPAPAPPVRPRPGRHAPGPAGDHLRADRAAAGQAAAGQFGAGALPDLPCFEKQGGFPVDRGEDLPLLHRAEARREPAVGRSLDALQRRDRADHRRPTSSGCGRPTSSTTWPPRSATCASPTASSARSSSTTWRSGSGSRSSTTSAPKKVEQSKIDDELKKKQHPDPARLVHRSRACCAASPASSASSTPEGLPVRRGQAGDQGSRGRTEAGNVTFNITEGPKVRIRGDRLRRQQGDQRRRAATKMKENKGGGFFSFIIKRRHLQGREVRRGRREGHRLLPRPRLRRGAGRPAGAEDLEDSKDGKTRWVQLQIPSPKGTQYKVGDFKFEGNTVVEGGGTAAALQDRTGRDLQPEEDQEGDREGPGGLRHRRLLRVHRLPGLEAA